MSWDYTIEPARRLGIVKASGVITADALRDGMQRAHADPLFHPDLNVLLDYSEVTGWQVPTDFMMRVAESRQLSAKSKTAIWTTDVLSYGMGRAYQAWAPWAR
jgi:hypothetical protein